MDSTYPWVYYLSLKGGIPAQKGFHLTQLNLPLSVETKSSHNTPLPDNHLTFADLMVDIPPLLR